MTVLHALVLGAIQGLTEFLPISSSGHLIFVPYLFQWKDQGATFDVIVHLGTLVAVGIYFREKLWRLCRAWLALRDEQGRLDEMLRKERRFGWLLLISIIPALVAGFLLSIVFEIDIRSPQVVAWGLIGWGIVLGIADIVSRRMPRSEHMTVGTAIFIGCAQAIALIPGTSRSGITMSAGLFSGLSKKAAAEFSFLMSIPVILIAGALNILELFTSGRDAVPLFPLLVGFCASAISGYLAIWGLIKIIEKWSFLPFVIYRIAVGIVILVFLV